MKNSTTRPNDPAAASQEVYNGQIVVRNDGLTKREYFAAMAMQGILASPDFIDQAGGDNLPKFAVDWADALIDALNAKTD